jgi:hypothetical protein
MPDVLADRRRSRAEIADDVMATKLFARLWDAGCRSLLARTFDDEQWAAWVRESSVPENVRARVIDEMEFFERERRRSA